MSHDARVQYWREALVVALEASDTAAARDLLRYNIPLIDNLAADLTISAENWSTAFGHDAIPNPLTEQVDAAVSSLTQERDAHSSTTRKLYDAETLISDLRYRIRQLEREKENAAWRRLTGNPFP